MEQGFAVFYGLLKEKIGLIFKRMVGFIIKIRAKQHFFGEIFGRESINHYLCTWYAS